MKSELVHETTTNETEITRSVTAKEFAKALGIPPWVRGAITIERNGQGHNKLDLQTFGGEFHITHTVDVTETPEFIYEGIRESARLLRAKTDADTLVLRINEALLSAVNETRGWNVRDVQNKKHRFGVDVIEASDTIDGWCVVTRISSVEFNIAILEAIAEAREAHPGIPLKLNLSDRLWESYDFLSEEGTSIRDIPVEHTLVVGDWSLISMDPACDLHLSIASG